MAWIVIWKWLETVLYSCDIRENMWHGLRYGNGWKQCFNHVVSEKICGMDCDMEMVLAENSALNM